MAKTIQCPSCAREYPADPKLGGKKVRCQNCGQEFAVSVKSVTPELAAMEDAAPLTAALAPSHGDDLFDAIASAADETAGGSAAWDAGSPLSTTKPARRRRRKKTTRATQWLPGLKLAAVAAGGLAAVGFLVWIVMVIASNFSSSGVATLFGNGWKEFRSEEHRFSVLFPGEASQVADAEAGGIRVSAFGLETDKGDFAVLCIHDPGASPADDESARLQLRNVARSKLNLVDSDVRKEESLTLEGGYPGLELYCENPNPGDRIRAVHYRLFRVNTHSYYLVARTTGASSDNPDVIEFFDSFKLIEPGEVSASDPGKPAAESLDALDDKIIANLDKWSKLLRKIHDKDSLAAVESEVSTLCEETKEFLNQLKTHGKQGTKAIDSQKASRFPARLEASASRVGQLLLEKRDIWGMHQIGALFVGVCQAGERVAYDATLRQLPPRPDRKHVYVFAGVYNRYYLIHDVHPMNWEELTAFTSSGKWHQEENLPSVQQLRREGFVVRWENCEEAMSIDGPEIVLGYQPRTLVSGGDVLIRNYECFHLSPAELRLVLLKSVLHYYLSPTKETLQAAQQQKTSAEPTPRDAASLPREEPQPEQPARTEPEVESLQNTRFRTWSDSTGTFEIEALLIDVQDGKVSLHRRDGQSVDVPLKRLCEADQAYVAAMKGAEAGTDDVADVEEEPDLVTDETTITMPQGDCEDTKMAGGDEGGRFRHEDEKPLLGITYRLGRWDGEETVGRIKPVFDRQATRRPQSAVIAKAGYAVGALEVDAKRFVNAMQIVFMRLNPDGSLDPSQSYTSQWIGFRTSSRTTKTISGKGALVVGIYGRHGAILNAVGLIVKHQ